MSGKSARANRRELNQYKFPKQQVAQGLELNHRKRVKAIARVNGVPIEKAIEIYTNGHGHLLKANH